mgnify:CR=1 FL=1
MMKLNLIWKYVLSCNSFILFILTLKFVEFTVVLIGFLCFVLKYLSISFYRKIAKDVSLVKYVKVKKDASVYNGDLKYWSRRAITPDLKTKTKDRLLKRQSYKCFICGKTFLPFDTIETDHITPIAKGGSRKITNLQLLHAVCYDRKI